MTRPDKIPSPPQGRELRDVAASVMLSRFDPDYFLARHRDKIPESLVAAEAFQYYLDNVTEAALDPHSEFSETFYLENYGDVKIAVERGRFLCGYHHFLVLGEREGRSPQPRHPAFERAVGDLARLAPQSEFPLENALKYFDPKIYVDQYHQATGVFLSEDGAARHFLEKGIWEGYVPTSQFDEEFYLSYYADVREAKRRGLVPSGFYHYIVAGAQEGRATKHDLGPLLKAKLGGLSEPAGIARVEGLERRLKRISFFIDPDRPPVINVFAPSLDPDIMFGGYIAFVNFLCRLVEAGQSLRLLVMEDGQSNFDWLLRGIASRERWLRALSKTEFVNCVNAKVPVAFSPADRCLSYSAWTTLDAWNIAQHLEHKRVAFFIQEFEAIFHENDSPRFIVESAYRVPHVAIFNTAVLEKYFREERIGVFGRYGSGIALSFEHALLAPAPGSPDRSGGPRKLFFYARPERHAARNLFEIGIMALKAAIQRGIFEGEWEFCGLGSLGNECEVSLGDSHSLKIRSRLSLEAYRSMLRTFDVGLSLMWAPHPSVVPFELANSGVVTVINEFGSRTLEDLARYGHNIVPAEATMDGIVEALAEAVRRSADYAARLEAKLDWPTNWDEVFDEDFIDRFLKIMEIPGSTAIGN